LKGIIVVERVAGTDRAVAVQALSDGSGTAAVMLSPPMSIRARSWYRSNTFHHGEFSVERIAAERTESISICLPARDEERTIGPILEALLPLRDAGAVDQIVVVDDSADSTPAIARSLGVEVHDQALLAPEHGPVLGKGDAMWRSLHVLSGEIVCFLDADSECFGQHFACGLLGPLVCGDGIALVKGLYRRPFRVGETTLPEGGGRVTELTARPLLNLFYPDLAGVAQPLAGEIAARRELLESLPFVTGYGVDIALLIDAYREVGLEGIAQVDLDVRQNAHQPLRDLGPMAFAVLHALASRLRREGRLSGPLPATFMAPECDELATLVGDPIERPPVAKLRAAA
jgi:glucosyl-3-phosphoglycerate synthase